MTIDPALTRRWRESLRAARTNVARTSELLDQNERLRPSRARRGGPLRYGPVDLAPPSPWPRGRLIALLPAVAAQPSST